MGERGKEGKEGKEWGLGGGGDGRQRVAPAGPRVTVLARERTSMVARMPRVKQARSAPQDPTDKDCSHGAISSACTLTRSTSIHAESRTSWGHLRNYRGTKRLDRPCRDELLPAPAPARGACMQPMGGGRPPPWGCPTTSSRRGRVTVHRKRRRVRRRRGGNAPPWPSTASGSGWAGAPPILGTSERVPPQPRTSEVQRPRRAPAPRPPAAAARACTQCTLSAVVTARHSRLPSAPIPATSRPGGALHRLPPASAPAIAVPSARIPARVWPPAAASLPVAAVARPNRPHCPPPPTQYLPPPPLFSSSPSSPCRSRPPLPPAIAPPPIPLVNHHSPGPPPPLTHSERASAVTCSPRSHISRARAWLVPWGGRGGGSHALPRRVEALLSRPSLGFSLYLAPAVAVWPPLTRRGYGVGAAAAAEHSGR